MLSREGTSIIKPYAQKKKKRESITKPYAQKKKREDAQKEAEVQSMTRLHEEAKADFKKLEEDKVYTMLESVCAPKAKEGRWMRATRSSSWTACLEPKSWPVLLPPCLPSI